MVVPTPNISPICHAMSHGLYIPVYIPEQAYWEGEGGEGGGGGDLKISLCRMYPNFLF